MAVYASGWLKNVKIIINKFRMCGIIYVTEMFLTSCKVYRTRPVYTLLVGKHTQLKQIH